MAQPVAHLEEPDAELVARWLDGDERAAVQLVARHGPALGRYAISLGARDEAEDLVQDTFVRAFGALDQFRGEASLRTWLFTILRRLLLDRRRTEGRRGREEPLDEQMSDGGTDALRRVVAAEMSERVQEALQQLTRLQREVFQLRVGEGMSYRDIAGLVGSTEGAARVHYHNAVRALREILDD
jgi:RNA polymerase sigma-70 factor (ECF subfamily)